MKRMNLKIGFLLFLLSPFLLWGFGLGDGLRQITPVTGGGGGAIPTIIIPFNTLSASTEPGKAGGYDEGRGTITLSPTVEQGARFGAELIPPQWDQVSQMKLKLFLGTPTGAALASMVFQLKVNPQGVGNSFFSDSSWVTVGTFTMTLAATTTIQTFSPIGFYVPASNLAKDRYLPISINRIGADANDTHPAQIHILGLRGVINE